MQNSEESKDKTIDDYMKESIQTLTTLGVTIDSFKVLEDSIGRGTYGEVKLVERDGVRYAMKSLVKEDIMKVRLSFRRQSEYRSESWTMSSESRTSSGVSTSTISLSFIILFR